MRKHRRLWLSAAASVALAFSTVSAASADDPATDKAQVDQQLAEAQGEIRESTAALAAATSALQSVDTQLTAAQAALATAQSQLEAAHAEDVRLAAELTTALSTEDAAELRLVELQADIDHNRDMMTALARSTYQGGQLSQISALLESQSLGDYTERIEGMRSVLHAQGAVVDSLADSRAQQSTTQAELEDVRERVAAARSDAAANLVAKDALEKDAAAATAEVQRLRDARAQVVADAQASLAADEAEHQSLQAERTRLEALLAERAAAQAAAAAAAETTSTPETTETTTTETTASSGALYRPVGGWVTSPYGWRIHPISGVRKFHDGTDFGSACGTPIHAAASGTVLSAYYAGGYGNQTVIEHGSVNGQYLSTSYNHQSSFAVSPGQHVDRGQVIGYVGTTGYSTGCHLHFIVYLNGSTTDPMNYL